MTEPSGGSTDKPRRPVVVPAVALVAIAALGITALLGGLSEATEEPEALGPGAVLDQGLYDTKIVASRVTVEKAESQFDKDKRFVELIFDVTNKGDATMAVGAPVAKPEQAPSRTAFAASLIKITPAFSQEAGPFSFARVKGGESRQLQPGVPNQVVVRYELQPSEQPPEKISFDMSSFVEEEQFLNRIPTWQMDSTEAGDKVLPVIKARVTLPVEKGEAQ
ncbi:hypothetical protein ABZ897_45735 [Nonomuraea sp. NPDC046802]|uniref:hypothetical protein n=1 Tax=Nonomuraea sp. NPDC046802 TaxID=3154919 RepID=UPI0033CEA29C